MNDLHMTFKVLLIKKFKKFKYLSQIPTVITIKSRN